MSIVTLFGRASRPDLPCLRAAVGPYLFHCSVIAAPLAVSWESLGGPRLPRHQERHETGGYRAQRSDRRRLGQRNGGAVGEQAVELHECRTAEVLHEDTNAGGGAG